MAKLTKELISKIAEDMVSIISEEKKCIETSMNELFFKKSMELIEEEVKIFYEKYPSYTRVCSSHYYRSENGKVFYFHCEVPSNNKDLVELVMKNSEDEFIKLFEKYIYCKNKEVQLKNKIMCNLSKLHTYKRVEDNFPEAYTVLFKIIGKPIEDNLNLCDSVENLRAEINSIKR